METYKIEPLALDKFINDKNYKLPRYQRKDTWKADQYFKLCISLFQGYPIGVSIVNSKDNIFWLLDGRQRRTCLKTLAENPVTVYEWAKKFCNLKTSDSPLEVREKFFYEVKRYLGSDTVNDSENPDGQESTDDSPENDEEIEIADFEETDKDADTTIFRNLTKLLDYILMVHPGTTKSNSWFKAFDFKDFFRNKSIPYIHPDKDNPAQYKIEPYELCKFIRDTYDKLYDVNSRDLSIKNFIDYVEQKWDFKGEEGSAEEARNKKNFEQKIINERKDAIINSYKAISELDSILGNARIGMIYLTNASTLDAQNIFSRINKEGTQLNASELLSAKPYWNIKVELPPAEKQKVAFLYKKLKIDFDNECVRWDVPATLLSRIDTNKLFFSSGNTEDNAIPFDVNEVTYGFKILSACMVKGISKISLDKLEEKDKLRWDDYLSDFSTTMKNMINIIRQKIPEFKTLQSWNKTIGKLLGDAPTFELLTVAYENYSKNIDDMIEGSTKLREFISGVKNHFDRLILEKVLGRWKGSSDSQFARNVSPQYIATRNAALTQEEISTWDQLIEGAMKGKVNNQDIKQEATEVLLYYAKMIISQKPDSNDTVFDTDHIYPQSYFGSNGNIEQALCHSLGNLAILPRKINESKKEKVLSNIKNEFKQDVSWYEGIPIDLFDKFSQPENMQELFNLRNKEFEKIFKEKRRNYLLKN